MRPCLHNQIVINPNYLGVIKNKKTQTKPFFHSQMYYNLRPSTVKFPPHSLAFAYNNFKSPSRKIQIIKIRYVDMRHGSARNVIHTKIRKRFCSSSQKMHQTKLTRSIGYLTSSEYHFYLVLTIFIYTVQSTKRLLWLLQLDLPSWVSLDSS